MLIEKGLQYEEDNSQGDRLFNQGLKAKIIDCDNASFIHLSIAEVLNLPVSGVRAPRHFFVRWNLGDNEHVNWEAVGGAEFEDIDYLSRLNISKESIDSEVFLRNLTREETIASEYLSRGVAWSNQGDPDRALKDYNKAIRLDPNFDEENDQLRRSLMELEEKNQDQHQCVLDLQQSVKSAEFKNQQFLFSIKELGEKNEKVSIGMCCRICVQHHGYGNRHSGSNGCQLVGVNRG
ncbi:MAG: tetratricopeptide repeat protein [Thaumarchaeota archaeon]|nr:tetratricopeptide repeat protein [Nitrososphaerota archaeon]